MDGANWASYLNFEQMYDCIADELVACNIAERLPEPLWMDKEGNVMESAEEAYGQRCTIRINYPELCFVADEVGSNISQTGDGNVGGSKVVCGSKCVPQKKASKKNKHFTVMGITALTGEPLMCVVIIEGVQRQVEIELGLDLEADCDIGSYDDVDFVKNNTGPGKRFPGGPTCHFRGQEIPFIQYINNESTRHSVSIGVPYGTSYWQVGDSSEQNGSFKMAITREKESILRKRELNGNIDKMTIEPSDIMLLVNEAWNKSFARVATNKKAIAERGWFPYNRKLLQHPDILTTKPVESITDSQETYLSFEAHDLSPSSQMSDLTLPTFDPQYVSSRSIPCQVNLDKGMGLTVLSHIVRENDIMLAGQRSTIEPS